MEQYRKEIKYLLSEYTARGLYGLLSQTLQVDKNGNFGAYIVRSLYFDTPNNLDYWEKIEGVEHRKKIRLRFYPSSNGKIRLELKEKLGDLQRKRVLILSEEDVQSLMHAEYTCLLHYNNSIAQTLYLLMNEQLYRPQCIVQYERIAFTAPACDTRVTLDSRVETGVNIFDFLNESPTLYPALSPALTVLEIKYSGFLPEYVKEIVSACGKITASSSKYCWARGILLY